jgi:Zn finger protein HypA/HybF involved in hydrogenase expression
MSRQQELIDQRRDALNVARKYLVEQIKSLEADKRMVDDQIDKLEIEELEHECSECADAMDEDDWAAGKCKDCQSADKRQYAKEYGEVTESDYAAGRGLPR